MNAAPERKGMESERFDRTFTFKIRRHKSGSFKNLWQLVAKMEGGEPMEIIDADSLSLVIDKIGYLFEKEGY